MATKPPPVLLLAKAPCSECLTSKARIVPGARAAQIVASCRDTGNHFRCHKGDLAGLVVHCRGVHDRLGGSQAYRVAAALGIAVQEVDADQLGAAHG